MTLKYFRLILLTTLIHLMLGFTTVSAEEDLSALFATQTNFLKVDEAFVLTTEIVDDEIIAKFEVADSYYLYKSRFYFSAEGATLKDAFIPDGKKKVDEYLGDVEVYYHNLEISVPFIAHQKEFTFIIEYQGCAEAGLCYPPEEKRFQLFADNVFEKAPIDTLDTEPSTQSTIVKSSMITKENDSPLKNTAEFVPEQEKVVNFLTNKTLFEIVLYFITLGIALAFTPCVLPMVPILSSIIVGQGNKVSSGKAFGLSLAYTQAMAIPYTIMGILVGAAGSSLSNTLQEPIFIIIAAVIFVLLSLSMFGFYELQLPQALQNKLNKISNSQQGGSYLSAAVMGAISALVVSPCVTVPLAGVLIYIAQTGDQVVGGVALYSLAVGMGIPLLIVGVGGNKLLPKSGNWMNAVKAVFGVVMLAMALYIAKHLIPGPIYLAAWAVLLVVSAVYMGALSTVSNNLQKLWKGIGLILLVYGFILILGAAMGNSKLLAPLDNLNLSGPLTSDNKANTQNKNDFVRVKTIADVQQKINQANLLGKNVMFDFFAESCTACYEFEEKVFHETAVMNALSNTLLIQADVTANDSEDKALMAFFEVRGLPSILFFDLEGQEDKRLRAIGFEEAEIFTQRINAAFKK